jgi:hypothetical protein
VPFYTDRIMAWLRVAMQAVKDAVRAWAVVPHVYRFELYGPAKSGGLGVRYRRRFRPHEVLRLKTMAAIRTLRASAKVGFAQDVIVNRYPEEGLLANFLHVVEVLHRLRPGTPVHVDWTITGSEIGFRYGKRGEDVWGQLFRVLGPTSTGKAHRASRRLDLAFWGTGKDHLSGQTLQKHREAYHSTLLNRVEIINPRVLTQVDEVCVQHFHARFCIGVHRRVGNAMVANLQATGNIPTLQSIVQTVESVISVAKRGGISDYAVFLATDDADAAAPFRDAFGSNLVLRENVQRTTAAQAEVHFGGWDNLSIRDAEDALIDSVLLSRCNVMVHGSSSVSTVAAIMNPGLILIHA